MPPIPPYEYPSPVARSSPGDTPNVRKTRTVGPEQPGANVPTPEPPARQPKPFIERPRQRVSMSHPETVTLPPIQEVIRQPKPSKMLTPEPSKVLTPVNRKAPEKINGKLTDQPQSVNFSPKPTLNFSGPKLPKKVKHYGRKGRQRTNEQVVELLTFVQTRGTWPYGVSDQMQRYYRREYPEYFRKKGRKGSTAGKIPVARPAPINIQARRSGTSN